MEKDRELEKLVQNSEKQLKHARFQSLMAAVAAVCFVILVIAALVVAPRLMDVSRQLDTIATEVEGLMLQADTVMGNLETVTGELAEADLAGMIEGIDGLVSESQANLSGAFEKINSIDIEKLNLAIDSLAKVIEPLTKFFGIFG